MTLHQTLRNVTRETLAPLIPRDLGTVFLVDPPDQPNVGDSAILLGEMAFIEELLPQTRVRFLEEAYRHYQPPDTLDRADFILFHGGGNFGDLWPRHHAIRLDVMRRFPHKLQLQFPISVHFQEQSSLVETQRVIDKIKDFTLVLRDQNSLNYAEKHFSCRTVLCPDMAFCMDQPVARDPTLDLFCLMRTDKEMLNDNSPQLRELAIEFGLTHRIDDWLDPQDLSLKYPDRLTERLLAPLFRRIAMPERAYDLVKYLRLAFSRRRVNRGLDMIGSGRIVVTDRLHAHILSVILGRKNYVFDSLDGKISHFYQTWTQKDVNCAMVKSFETLRGALSSNHDVQQH